MDISEYRNIYLNESTHFYYVNMHNLIIDLLKKYTFINKIKILDAGCGTGMLLKKMPKAISKYGIDISPEAVRYCKKRGLNNVIQGSITKIPFLKNIFDTATSIDVIYHSGVKSDKIAVSELYRVLKPNGILIIKVPAYKWLLGKHDQIVKTKKRYTKKDVVELLDKNGFQILKISYSNIFLFPVVIVKRLIIERLFPNIVVSDVKKEGKLINNILILLGKIENFILKFTNLPCGLDVIAVAKKN